ncbi:hypothetical protein [Bacillus sp. T33-2]|nr:hypothetical protein [Bacillus sp. T33-2]
MGKKEQNPVDKNMKTDSYEVDVESKGTNHLDKAPKPHGRIANQITPDLE